MEAARVWAQNLLHRGGQTPEQRFSLAFRLATARPPSPSELGILVQSYERVLGQFQADHAAALKLVSTGEAPRDPNLDVAQLAAHTAVLNMMLNLDEAITKE